MIENKDYFILTAEELLDTKYCSSDQTILGMLKEKGAPIEGTFFLQVKPGYTVIKNKDHKKGSYCYEFRKTK